MRFNICPQLLITEAKMKEVKRGEVYYANLSPIVGSEQDGRRPVVILQNGVFGGAVCF